MQGDVRMEKSEVFGLIGAGGFGREVMPIFQKFILSIAQFNVNAKQKIFFVEDTPTQEYINNIKVISIQEFIKMESDDKFFNIAFANSKARQVLAEKLINQGIKPLPIQADNATVYDNNEIGEGVILCAYSTITSNVKIGKFFHSNIYSYVAHDCIIGDYVTFAPRVCCNGRVHIQDHAYIGTGAVIKEGSSDKPLVIGEGSVVGMGAVVTKDVPPYTTVVGNPAKIFTKQ